MNRWRSILSVLIMLWLPLQGYAAVAMPFCEHSMAVVSTHDGAVGHAQHQHDGHMGHMVQAEASSDMSGVSHSNHAGSHDGGGLGCNNCGNCHLACSPVISAVVPVYVPIGNFVLESAAADTPRFFYPEPPQHPPLSALL